MTDSFGSVKINDQRYDEDIVLHVDGNVTKRKKKRSKDLKPRYGGHTPLSERELDFLEKEEPEVVYIGTGYEGALPINSKAKSLLEMYETSISRTPKVAKVLKGERRKFVAILHVTC